jgi:hypothetical protein
LSTVLPAVLSAVAGVAVVAVVGTGSAQSASAASVTDPVAKLVQMYRTPGGARVIGWDYDPNSPKSAVHTYATVDHKVVNSTTANIPRSDVKQLHPSAGPNHGFNWFVPVPQGVHLLCISAQNIGKGANHLIVCVRADFEYGPLGSLESVTAAHGALDVKGWTMDGDNVKAGLTTTITVDGKANTVVANKAHSGISNVRAGAGPNHGFDAKYAVAQGNHTVCVTVKNIGYGTNTSFGCRTVTLNDSPRGNLSYLVQSAGQLYVSGWGFDPDAPTSALTATVTIDKKNYSVVANGLRTDVAAKYPNTGKNHGFAKYFALAEGSHSVCVTIRNVSFGKDLTLGCRTVVLNFTPSGSLTALTATSTGATISGWASDPDTVKPITVRLSVDGRATSTLSAAAKGATHSGHNYSAALSLRSGKHTVCAVAVNVLYGHTNSPASCRTITLALRPIGKFESLKRVTGSTNLAILGWTLDGDTTGSLSVAVTLDGKAFATVGAAAKRTDVAKLYPVFGSAHGIASVLTANSSEHTVCLTAKNVGGGSDTSLGCRVINAVHPKAPTAPQHVTAQAGFGGATVTWTPPASDGGAPWSKFTIVASPGGATTTVGATTRSATIVGLKASTTYSFAVRAVNVAGTSVAGTSVAVKTQASPPAQTTPAPVSTSRYIRNIRTATAAEQVTMRNEGAADAKANPSGHGYLVLLDIGGQDQFDGGVVLSATTRFVSYAALVKDLEAYIDGYHSAQRASAPVRIAIGTNNDMDVSATTGKVWATSVVNPLVSYARRYTGISVAGANDIEPGFRASYAQTKSWLSGYLSATSAAFIFNGSADGCAWTVVNRGCNNGWTMAGLYYLAAGAASIRMLNLPQIYNTTMADQWKYISLTGIAQKMPRINFAGTLTEWTACAQSSSCGSLSGRSAWSAMWSNLQSDSRLKVSSLPYATDLRIDK